MSFLNTYLQLMEFTQSCMYIRGYAKFGIKVAWSLQFIGYLRTLRLKFQKARTKIGVFLGLPSWLSQFSWDSQQGRLRTTSMFVRAFWNFKRKVLKYSRNCSLHNILIPNLVKPLKYIHCTLLKDVKPQLWNRPTLKHWPFASFKIQTKCFCNCKRLIILLCHRKRFWNRLFEARKLYTVGKANE